MFPGNNLCQYLCLSIAFAFLTQTIKTFHEGTSRLSTVRKAKLEQGWTTIMIDFYEQQNLTALS